MTTNLRPNGAEQTGRQPPRDLPDHQDRAATIPVPVDAVEAILRQLVALRASTGIDDQLAQLVRIVDSATWSATVPMTVIVDGTLMRGALVPSEVSATFLDNALRSSAHAAVDELEGSPAEGTPDTERRDGDATAEPVRLQQARAFLQRLKRRPFATSQARLRQRNANALVALNDWHRTRDNDSRLSPFDVPGKFVDPGSPARDIVPYTVGQRALTLVDVKVMVAGEWQALSTPVRIAVSRIGAWTVDL
jgi:hypothetical protein